MTDDEILKTIEASIKSTMAQLAFYRHAFCILIQQNQTDLKALMKGIQSLTPENNDELFQTSYSEQKKLLLSDIVELHKEQTSQG